MIAKRVDPFYDVELWSMGGRDRYGGPGDVIIFQVSVQGQEAERRRATSVRRANLNPHGPFSPQLHIGAPASAFPPNGDRIRPTASGHLGRSREDRAGESRALA